MISYFAYGSNLWIEQLVARIGPLPLAPCPRIARLPGYRLSFNMRGDNGEAHANIIAPGEFVLGVVYPIALGALQRLDRFEDGYDREQVTVVDLAGASIDAFVYRAKPENVMNGVSPSAEYLQKILCGGRQHGLPEAYIYEIEKLARTPAGDRASEENSKSLSHCIPRSSTST